MTALSISWCRERHLLKVLCCRPILSEYVNAFASGRNHVCLRALDLMSRCTGVASLTISACCNLKSSCYRMDTVLMRFGDFHFGRSLLSFCSLLLNDHFYCSRCLGFGLSRQQVFYNGMQSTSMSIGNIS